MPTYVGIALNPTTPGSRRYPPPGGWHDLHLDATGNLAMVYDSEAIAQHGKQRLKTYLGEWFLDPAAGVPWLQQIFVRPFNSVVAEALIKREILTTPGITQLSGFQMQVRNWTVTEFGGIKDMRHLDVVEAEAVSVFDEPITVQG